MEHNIMLLTIYKQHYLDRYDTVLNSQYSCWGYYDGMDIVEVTDQKYSNLTNNSNIEAISKVWYKTGEKETETNGCYSSQNIGLFRCIKNRDENVKCFWNENEHMVFFGVAFLQLSTPEEYENIGIKIEDSVFIAHEISENQKICRVTTYCTLDNAGLVLLIHSNSLQEMERCLEKIESFPQIRYQHSILGVSEQYLKDSAKQGNILVDWYGKHCFIDETVARLDIHLASSGDDKMIEIEKTLLDKINKEYKLLNYDKAKYSYVSGHENFVISLEDTNVRSMLVLLLPGGFATHQNESYIKRVCSKDKSQQLPRLYNIETSYMLKNSYLSQLDEWKYPTDSEEVKVSSWFHDLIEQKYRLLAQEAVQKADESLYAYFLALLKTMNTLVQYEHFGLSEDIYYLLYPSFNMFHEKLIYSLNDVWTNPESNDYPMKMERIKQCIREYVEAVNSVIYHTIHTDQIFLMIPGYSGTSFSIPIKLNMMFLWVTDSIAQILGNNGRKYRCILVPNMESKPQTRRIQFSKNEKDFLVYVKVSQRTLYTPQSLMIILCHEMGHYIGGDARCRRVRMEKLAKVIARYMAELIFPLDEGLVSQAKIIQDIMLEQFQIAAENFIHEQLIQLEKDKYYGDEVRLKLYDACQQILIEDKLISEQSIAVVEDKLKGNIQNYLSDIYQLIRDAKRRVKTILIKNIMLEIIDKEISLYRELFSDIVARKLLDCSEDEFVDAWCISEGQPAISETASRRMNVMKAIKSSDEKLWKSLNGPLDLADTLLYEYVVECNKWFDWHISKGEDMEELISELRSLYKLFGKNENSMDNIMIHESYNRILHVVSVMKEDIKTDINNKIT